MHHIQKSDVKQCRTCGAQITFLKYASGKWYPADVYPARDGVGYLVDAGSGAHNNFKRRHVCVDREKQAAAHAEFQAQRIEGWKVILIGRDKIAAALAEGKISQSQYDESTRALAPVWNEAERCLRECGELAPA